MNTKSKQDQKKQEQKSRQVQGKKKQGLRPVAHHEQECPETRMTD